MKEVNMRFKVAPDHSIRSPDGSRFLVRGVTAFDGLFVSYEETRTDWNFRHIGIDPTKTPASGISEPTYGGATVFVNIDAEIQILKESGINLVRIAVENALFNASVPYTYGGVTCPSDIDMLDYIINAATSAKIVVQLQSGNDLVPPANNREMLIRLVRRYGDNPYVWINPANEINCAPVFGVVQPACTNPTAWLSEMEYLVQAVRSAGFKNPIVINTPGYSNMLPQVFNLIVASQVLGSDDNLIVGPHLYVDLATDWYGHMSDFFTGIASYVNKLCIVIDELGINATGLYRDPLVDPGYPGAATPAVMARVYGWTRDCFRTILQMEKQSAFSGATLFCWRWWVPGMGCHDSNSLRRFDKSITPWGVVARDNFFYPDLTDDLMPSESYALKCWDWQAADNASVITRENNIVSFTGTIQQKISTPGDWTNQVVTVSFEMHGTPAGQEWLSVYFGDAGTPGKLSAGTLQVLGGRVRATVILPSISNELWVTAIAPDGAKSFRDMRVTKGFCG